jgi:hypothetical protein
MPWFSGGEGVGLLDETWVMVGETAIRHNSQLSGFMNASRK